MSKILINNFGPIKNIEIPIPSYSVFVGPQASGKSTISKAIFYFKHLKDELVRFIYDNIDNSETNLRIGSFGKIIKQRFFDIFGTTLHLHDLCILFDYGNNNNIELSIENNYLHIEFNPSFNNAFYSAIDELNKYVNKASKKNTKYLTATELMAIESERRQFLNTIKSLSSTIFNDNDDLYFIPAGRSVLTILTDQLQNIQTNKIDYIMKMFLERIDNNKHLFKSGLDGLVNDRIKLTDDKITFSHIKKAIEIINKILKAKYICDNEGEKLYFNDNTYTKLNFASSGQQESIWILLTIFLIILENQKSFIIFEEPEAHLYPSAQKEIIDLIAVCKNATNSNILITTHSPYILSSINNQLYAFNSSKRSHKSTNNIINENHWIDSSNFSSFKIDSGKSEDIFDREHHLINSEVIESISNELNLEFEKLVELNV